MSELCRSNWYADTGHVQVSAHHDRSIHCGLPRGHDGDHDEMLDGEPAGVATWPQKPDVRRLPLAGQVLARTNFENTTYGVDDHEKVADIERANLITSIVVIDIDLPVKLAAFQSTHKVVIDIDLPVKVVASSTPGHFHLYIDKEMNWATYLTLLEAFVAAGIVERGYLAAARSRGHTAVRLPWVQKYAGSLTNPHVPRTDQVGFDA